MSAIDKKVISFLIIVICFLNTYAQKNDSSSVGFTFDIEAQLLHQNYKKTNVTIDNVSDVFGNRIMPQSKEVTDNPFIHNAFYALMKNKISVYNKYQLKLDLLMEHRGMSYGFSDMNNVVFFPYYMFNVNESINFLNEQLDIFLQKGSFMNQKMHQGLKIYNTDYHGGNLTLNWREIFFQFNQIGDLSFATGLRIEELYDYSIGFNVLNKQDKKLSFGFNLSDNNYAPRTNDSIILEPLGLPKNVLKNYHYINYGIWGKYTVRQEEEIYFQYEIRKLPYINILENSALLVGGEIKINNSKFSLLLNPEFRYYGWMYNYGHRDDLVSYRKNPSDTSNYYSNTVGRYLYPLMNYNNNFSQWAVYTDYQYQNIAGIELRANIKRQLYKNINIELEAESCTLIKEYEYQGEKTFTYLFYSGQLVYIAGNIFKIGLGLSNKSMNLDKHYQTFYMRKKPAIYFFIRKELTKN